MLSVLLLVILISIPVVWLIVRKMPVQTHGVGYVIQLSLLAVFTLGAGLLGLASSVSGAFALWGSDDHAWGPPLMIFGGITLLAAAGFGWGFLRVWRRGNQRNG